MNTITQQIIHDLEQLPESVQSDLLDLVKSLKKTTSSKNGQAIVSVYFEL
ncbi:hypothetical protein QUF50_02400 [Thiotrichales bacterium HSG1]|nr:hypothetical protein [Thiotrichales bacterium HSG1]